VERPRLRRCPNPISAIREPFLSQALTEPSPPAVLGQLVVTGLQRATTLTIADLEALGAEDVPWTFRDEPHVYRAVALDRVLSHCGFDERPGGRSISPTERSHLLASLHARRMPTVGELPDVLHATVTECRHLVKSASRGGYASDGIIP
jgi:hypothetical protein